MIDFTQPIMNLEGKPLQVNDNAMTLRSVCIRVLLLPENLKKEPSPDEKVKWFMLAQQIQQNDKLELSAKDKTLICDLVGQMYKPLIVGQVFIMLDPERVKSL